MRPKAAVAALLLAALATVAPGSGLAQELALTADVGKTTFFEDEPIYLLVRLQNVGTDTASTYFFGFSSSAVTLSVRRGHGKPVEVAKLLLEHRVAPSSPKSWGLPLAERDQYVQKGR